MPPRLAFLKSFSHALRRASRTRRAMPWLGHHALEADRAVLRALPLVDRLLDADVGRADGEDAEAAAAGHRLGRVCVPSSGSCTETVALMPFASVTSSVTASVDLSRASPRARTLPSRRRRPAGMTVVDDDQL